MHVHDASSTESWVFGASGAYAKILKGEVGGGGGSPAESMYCK